MNVVLLPPKYINVHFPTFLLFYFFLHFPSKRI